jgi:DNA polymerase-3 subunit epsilon
VDFIAVDFETANSCFASICQVGIAEFAHGKIATTFSSLINPEDHFDGKNVSIHGIGPADVTGAPTFPDIYPRLIETLSGRIIVSHMPFDRCALKQVTARYNLADIDCRWLDSARVVRRTWCECSRSGYGLKPMAARLGIKFKHHDASEDAKTAGTILLRALLYSGIGIEDWLVRSHHPLPEPTSGRENPAGEFYGDRIVFTGALQMVRRQATSLAMQMGYSIAGSVTKNTSILVVGDQDITRFGPGENKSAKHKKAEALIAAGAPIRIIGESDFLTLGKIDLTVPRGNY